jgi:hypothetical protein
MAFLPQGQLVVDSLMACPQHLCLRSGALPKPRPVPDTKTLNEDMNFGQHVTAPLKKHFVPVAQLTFQPKCHSLPFKSVKFQGLI